MQIFIKKTRKISWGFGPAEYLIEYKGEIYAAFPVYKGNTAIIHTIQLQCINMISQSPHRFKTWKYDTIKIPMSNSMSNNFEVFSSVN